MIHWHKQAPLIGPALVALAVLLTMICGCSSDTRSHVETLAYLQQGNFRGHITVHTDGQVGGEIITGVRGGASHSGLAASGTVDWSIPPGSGVKAGEMPEATTIIFGREG